MRKGKIPCRWIWNESTPSIWQLMKFGFLYNKLDSQKTKLLSSKVNFPIVISTNLYFIGSKFNFAKSNFDERIKTHFC